METAIPAAERKNFRKWVKVMDRLDRTTTKEQAAEMMDADGVQHGFREIGDGLYMTLRDIWIENRELKAMEKDAKATGNARRLREIRERKADLCHRLGVCYVVYTALGLA